MTSFERETSRCFHDHPPAAPDAGFPIEGAEVRGVVVCVHVFGLGIYLPEVNALGHVNTPSMGVVTTPTHGLDDYPAVGTEIRLRVLGISGTGQLRLSALPTGSPSA